MVDEDVHDICLESSCSPLLLDLIQSAAMEFCAASGMRQSADLCSSRFDPKPLDLSVSSACCVDSDWFPPSIDANRVPHITGSRPRTAEIAAKHQPSITDRLGYYKRSSYCDRKMCRFYTKQYSVDLNKYQVREFGSRSLSTGYSSSRRCIQRNEKKIKSAKELRSVRSSVAVNSDRDCLQVQNRNISVGCCSCLQPLTSAIVGASSHCFYRVHTSADSKCVGDSDAYFPHLARPGASAVFVCVFCYHTLLDQWRCYEQRLHPPSVNRRRYNTRFFCCCVCGVTTYRHRVRLLPVKDFPFLLRCHQWPSRGMLVCGGTQAVACLDCSQTLYTQSWEVES